MIGTLVTAALLLSEPGWITSLGGRVVQDPSGRVTAVTLASTWVTDADLEGLKQLPSLERLDLSHTRITDQGLLRLRSCTSVRDLDLYYAEQITDEGMAAVRDWMKLERVNLRGTKITDTTLQLLATLPAIRAVDVGYAQITDSGLQHLGALSGLRELAFGGNKLTDGALGVLYRLRGLERLDVAGRQRTDSGLWSVGLTDFGADPIATLSELRDLNLSGTQISARALEKLARLEALELLDLHGAKRVGDDAIPHLGALRRLRWLDLEGTSVTEQGAGRLRAALPRATVLR